MSKATPNIQPRNQFPRDWGNYAGFTVLPNASAWAGGTNPVKLLEAGDTAFVAGVGLVYCVSAGTAGALDAVWALSGVAQINLALAGEQTGTSELSLGMIYLTAGAVIAATSHAMLGATSGVADTADLRIRRFTGGAQVAIFSATGTPADTVITAAYTVAASDWYELTLAAGGVAQVASCPGVCLHVYGQGG